MCRRGMIGAERSVRRDTWERLHPNKNAIRRQTNYNYIVACFPIDLVYDFLPSSPCAFLQIKAIFTAARSQSVSAHFIGG